MLTPVLAIALTTMLTALLIGIIRLRMGPGVVDRIIIFDLFSSIAIGTMAISFLWLEDSTLLDVGLLLSVVSFIGTIGFARYLERRETR